MEQPMPLPEPILDDLRFQKDLVDEARRRIIRYCPEWTDYNLSDPGITLIELFAWMTELMTYRLNLVPEKNYIRFLDLLGMELKPASSARVELTFRLSVPFPITPEDQMVAIVPQGTEVATRASGEEEEAIFTTDEKLVVVPPVLTQLRREEDFNKNYLPRLGVEVFHVFSRKPQIGDTFYLGFDETQDLRGHILRLNFDCEQTQATGVRRSDPPLVWECSVGDGAWEELPLGALPGERDTTGGLNNETGALTLYLPLAIKPDQVHGRAANWIRCRLEQRRPEQGMYSQSPRIKHIHAYALGATTKATHAVIVREEILGMSNGEPGQTFRLKHAPVLALRESEGETVLVEEIREGESAWIPCKCVPDLASSDRHDRHFSLDCSTGEMSFGPAIRQPDGTVRQYGRVPEAGRQIVFSQYRVGGGVAGNVPAGKIQVVKSALPYIDRVTNLQRAEGGRDAETLEEAKLRARRELRAQQRAVTAEDYESLAKNASRAVARVKCLTPGGAGSTLPPGMVELLVVPAAFDALKVGDLSKLFVDPDLMKTIVAYLDQYRLLTTTLRVREPRYVGLKVEAEVVLDEYVQPEAVRARALESLCDFICPLSLLGDSAPTPGLCLQSQSRGTAAKGVSSDLMGPDWEGWPFGRALFISEVYSLLQKVPGIQHILDVKLYQRAVLPSKEEILVEGEEGQEPEARQALAPLTPITQRRLDVPSDTLLCSLDHEIKFVEM